MGCIAEGFAALFGSETEDPPSNEYFCCEEESVGGKPIDMFINRLRAVMDVSFPIYLFFSEYDNKWFLLLCILLPIVGDISYYGKGFPPYSSSRCFRIGPSCDYYQYKKNL